MNIEKFSYFFNSKKHKISKLFMNKFIRKGLKEKAFILLRRLFCLSKVLIIKKKSKISFLFKKHKGNHNYHKNLNSYSPLISSIRKLTWIPIHSFVYTIKNLMINFYFLNWHISGKKYLIPIYITKQKKWSFCLNPSPNNVHKRHENTFLLKLWGEFLSLFSKNGVSFNSKLNLLKNVMDNRHYQSYIYTRINKRKEIEWKNVKRNRYYYKQNEFEKFSKIYNKFNILIDKKIYDISYDEEKGWWGEGERI